MQLIPVEKNNLGHAIDIASTIFPHDVDEVKKYLSASINPMDKWDFADAHLVNKLHYDLLVYNCNIIGITGIYEEKIDPQIAWLGWFGLQESYRGKRLGRLLLQLTIDSAKKAHYDCLRLWTLDHPDYYNAIHLYKNMGFIQQKLSYALENSPVIIFSYPLTTRHVPLWNPVLHGFKLAGAMEIMQEIGERHDMS